ncbi:hypothetical protein VHUM_01356 [Vanrija humicola]|uniref:CSC1/OSCA1-like 7TM region domain-containing protein n=1 Tax=Vanrija humicola TaxID=5417 RepID=A0A7D8ZBU4_VANHU|nr:hypothetical protein VHUM_01356 [Vanrija humicola]
MAPPQNPLDDPDYEPPPPPVSNGMFAWLSPVVNVKEHDMIANIGLDAATFLRFVRMLRTTFIFVAILAAGLLAVDVVYNLKNVDSKDRTILTTITIQSVKGAWIWPALAVSYLINFIVMFLVWRNWHAMVQLRQTWFRSPGYQSKVNSRTLMITQVPKQYRSDEGLIHLLTQLKLDGIKIANSIENASVGRRLGDFPHLVAEHNEAVKDLEKVLVKYLKGGKMASKRPMTRIGGFMGMGGKKHDAIDYLAKQIKFLRDKIDQQRQYIDSLVRQVKSAKKGGRPPPRIEGDNFGFVTFKTIAEAHRIARMHRGSIKELGGAVIQLAPVPSDIVWKNINKDPQELSYTKVMGFILIALLGFVNLIPIVGVSTLSSLAQFAQVWNWVRVWSEKSSFTLGLATGPLPPILSATFSFFLPIVMRKICKYQGTITKTRLDRSLTARYFFFMVFAYLFVFVLVGTIFGIITRAVDLGTKHDAKGVIKLLEDIPGTIQEAYVLTSTYWLNWLPLRGFLVFFELIQLFKLALVSIRRFMFSYTPRDIRELTKPPYFEYPVVAVNLLFVATVGLVYAPIAPMVPIGAMIVFWFSSVVYKYQLLYVYISRAESGGRMWNVYVNRLIINCLLMQLLMVATTGLIRGQWLDAIAAVPPIIIMIGFKIFLHQTVEHKFKYYIATPQEAEQQQQRALFSEKHGKRQDLSRRFLHPSLQPKALYQVMVHKSQESLARQVLSAYPWFAGKHKHDGVEIKAVREENLEYNPDRDAPSDAQQDAWETRSIASTAALSKFEDGSVSRPPLHHSNTSDSFVPLRAANRSTDELLNHSGPGSQSGHRGSEDGQLPLLNRSQWDQTPADYNQSTVPYPPSSFNQAPYGYHTAPPLVRSGTNDSVGSIERGQPLQRYDTNGDLGRFNQGYNDPYDNRGHQGLGHQGSGLGSGGSGGSLGSGGRRPSHGSGSGHPGGAPSAYQGSGYAPEAYGQRGYTPEPYNPGYEQRYGGGQGRY